MPVEDTHYPKLIMTVAKGLSVTVEHSSGTNCPHMSGSHKIRTVLKLNVWNTSNQLCMILTCFNCM